MYQNHKIPKNKSQIRYILGLKYKNTAYAIKIDKSIIWKIKKYYFQDLWKSSFSKDKTKKYSAYKWWRWIEEKNSEVPL